MSIQTKSVHRTLVGENVFLDLGFASHEAAELLAESRRVIAEQQVSPKHLNSAARRKNAFDVFANTENR